MEFAQADAFLGMLLLIVLKFTTLIKVFIGQFLCEAALPEWGMGGAGK